MSKGTQSKDTNSPRILGDTVLFVEGTDEYHFFTALLKKLDIDHVYIRSVGGNTNFKEEIKILGPNTSNFSTLKKLGFVRDAEKREAKSAFDSICNFLKLTNYLEGVPRNMGKVEKIKTNSGENTLKIGIFIMPNNKDAGMLETLCLQSIQDDPFLKN